MLCFHSHWSVCEIACLTSADAESDGWCWWCWLMDTDIPGVSDLSAAAAADEGTSSADPCSPCKCSVLQVMLSRRQRLRYALLHTVNQQKTIVICYCYQSFFALKPWFHVKIKLFWRILGLHGTTSLADKIILFHFRRHILNEIRLF